MTIAEESKPSILSDPLILPSGAVSSDIEASPAEAEAADDYFPPISYVQSPRRIRDVPALVLFVLLSAATLVVGVVAAARRNPDFSRAKSFVFDPYFSSCVVSYLSSRSSNSISFSRSASNILISTLAITFFLSVPISLAILWLLRHYSKQLVYASMPLTIIIPSFLNVYWLVTCQLNAACRGAFPLTYRILVISFVFLLIVVALWIIVVNWRHVNLAARLVGVAAAVLVENLALLAVLPALVLTFIAFLSAVVVFLVLARFNGKVVPRTRGNGGGSLVEYYCEWEEEAWVPMYFALAIATLVWWAATIMEAQIYVVSGTAAQWYFNTEGVRPHRSLRNSLRNAFGPSFGTVCFSGMVMGAIRIVRSIIDFSQEADASPRIVHFVLRFCAKYLLSAINYVNKFTINFAAISGEGYCSSAKITYDLLKRNLLSAVAVEAVSTHVLSAISFALSALYAITVFLILRTITANSEMYSVAVAAWLLLAAVLAFLVYTLHNVTDVIYICYAIDRDKGEVCKQQVHEVYAHLPASRARRASSSLCTRNPLLS